MKKKILLAITLLPLVSMAKIQAFITFDEENNKVDIVKSRGWYKFFENDCDSNGQKTFNNLTEWMEEGNITCTENVSILPNISDLKKISGDFTIGDENYFYETNNLKSFQGLREVSGTLEAYLKGEGLYFQDLTFTNPAKINLGIEGIGNVYYDKINKYTIYLNGIKSIKSPVDNISLGATKIGQSWFPLYFENLAIKNMYSTPETGALYLNVDNTTIENLTVYKNYKNYIEHGNDENNYFNFQHSNTILSNVDIRNVDNLVFYTTGTVTDESPFLTSNIYLNNVYISNYYQSKFNDIDKITFENIKTTSSSISISDGKTINEYNERNMNISGISLSLTKFERIKNINIENAIMGGSFTYSADTIENISIKESEKDYSNFISNNEITNIEVFGREKTAPPIGTNLTINANVKNFVVDENYFGYIYLPKMVENISINNVISNGNNVLNLGKGVRNFSISVDPENFESFKVFMVNMENPIETLTINNPTNNLIAFQGIPAAALPSLDVLKDVSGVDLMYNGPITEDTFPNKLPMNSVFCQNYGTKTMFSSGSVDKSLICE